MADVGSTLSNSIFTRASLSSVTDVQSSVNQVGTSVDELHTKLDAQGAGTTRLEVERAIADGARVMSLMLPASAGGQLELARQIVNESLDGARAAGLRTTKAADEFAKGDAAAAAGDFRNAYLWYVSAYQQLLK